MPDRRAAIYKNVHSQLISDVILASLLNKLPHENLVNISPPKCALKSFTFVLGFCCMSFFRYGASF